MSKLVGLEFSFRYKKGADNRATDALSRVGHMLALDALSVCQPQWLQEVANSYEKDSEAQELLAQLAIKSPDDQGRVLRQGIIRQGDRLWIGANTALQTKLISAFHDSAVGGHSGITATYQRVRKLFEWPGLKRAVEDFVQQCLVSQQAKHEHRPPPPSPRRRQAAATPNPDRAVARFDHGLCRGAAQIGRFRHDHGRRRPSHQVCALCAVAAPLQRCTSSSGLL